MKTLAKNLTLLAFLLMFILSSNWLPAFNTGGSASDCDVDTSRIAVVEFTVLGMDSITINDVQDVLDSTCGVSFNFACWSDTVIFIEYDSVLTDKFRLMAVIEQMGYKPSIRFEH